LKPIAAKAGIPDMTYRALRRKFATEFQRHDRRKNAQSQLRHSKLEMTGWYLREIHESAQGSIGGGRGNLPNYGDELTSTESWEATMNSLELPQFGGLADARKITAI
jgi:hypothetical protein